MNLNTRYLLFLGIFAALCMTQQVEAMQPSSTPRRWHRKSSAPFRPKLTGCLYSPLIKRESGLYNSPSTIENINHLVELCLNSNQPIYIKDEALRALQRAQNTLGDVRDSRDEEKRAIKDILDRSISLLKQEEDRSRA